MINKEDLIAVLALSDSKEISLPELILLGQNIQDEYEWTNADAMIHNIARFLVNAADPEDDTPWYDFETGDDDLLWQIDCHPVFRNSTPCLNDVRDVEYKDPYE